jgi:DNA-damage-inducible protein D
LIIFQLYFCLLNNHFVFLGKVKAKMKKEKITILHTSFNSAINKTEKVEFWFARDLQKLLGYTQWRNFLLVIEKAKIACQKSNQEVLDHFANVSKMVDLGSGLSREIEDIMLSRYACYLIAQNGLLIRLNSVY